MTQLSQSNSPEGGPWLIRMAVGHPVYRAMEPLRAENHEQLEQVLSGFFAAISLLGPADHLQISIDVAR